MFENTSMNKSTLLHHTNRTKMSGKLIIARNQDPGALTHARN